MSTKNNPGGPGTSSPWNAAGPAFAPNTNTLDRESMPSSQAEAARLKSAAVMAALKNGDKGEADRLMGKENKPQGQLIPRGSGDVKGWWKKRFGGGRKGDGDGESVASSGVEKERVVVEGK
ncbi:hypothetical protein M409DRAFT_23002 [Zasmidium cellare ATCC 36951]|uniref:Uncharacterized protein n=1 Tax=Zasmidium cellare ATCC 36951 TaxID=1080233 RepID=A0A6A6CIH8_ZASCE|nr:uncharacterized protein M409DRAFT_23002 [Zasmidium cellare ATCC 36951]KAF2166955.1 hypothetical protein M409DRAFT_23002 [Zasmidium cellare ATCC 36951]